MTRDDPVQANKLDSPKALFAWKKRSTPPCPAPRSSRLVVEVGWNSLLTPGQPRACVVLREPCRYAPSHSVFLLSASVSRIKIIDQSAEVERSRRAATRASAEAEQATALLETARAEVTLVAERADEAVAGVARATRDGASALDDTRRMYEERLESCKSDCEARARAAEDRARAVEHERQRAEAARQAASKELARLQV